MGHTSTQPSVRLSAGGSGGAYGLLVDVRTPATTSADLPTVEQAWRRALLGPQGFYRRSWPAGHFATATQRGRLLARTVVALTRRAGLDAVVDLGAGSGELLAAVHAEDPSLRLCAVELRGRPGGLPAAVGWSPRPPARVDGLLVAHELLDTVACPVVRAGDDGVPRVLHVDPATGREQAGAAATGADSDWLARWWPLRPGDRAEVGRRRDDVWARVVGRLGAGIAIAVDYGHVRGARPPAGSLRAYARGRRVGPVWDGSADVTADVALDAVAARVGGRLLRQREVVAGSAPPAGLGQPPPLRPPGGSAADRLHALVEAGESAEVGATGGLGELGWVVSTVGVPYPC